MPSAPETNPHRPNPLRTRWAHWKQTLSAGLAAHPRTLLACLAVILLTGIIEWTMGRLLLGPDGRLAFWEGSIWSNACSQRFADPYSFSHVIHGMLFYGILWLVARQLPARHRFLLAVLLEAGWEILENSPLIINRYRQVTIALGYEGDSILNSLSDILMMSLGFLIAARCRIRTTLILLLLMELGCLLWIRDNLTLNIIMLVYPLAAIRNWQLLGQPPP